MTLDKETEENFHVYSPEASDENRHGDWRTKAVAIGFVLIALAVTAFFSGMPVHLIRWAFGCNSAEITSSGECR